jgi:threonine synthase
MSPQAVEIETKCSKCGKPGEVAVSPRWCRDCRAKYQREYERTKKEMQETRGYAAGVSAMRAHLVKIFSEIRGGGSFTAQEVAYYIQQAKGPFES